MKSSRTLFSRNHVVAFVAAVFLACSSLSTAYVVEDTGQQQCYDDSGEIACPSAGEAFYGQDPNYDGNQPSFTLSGDGLTVYDNVTGLTWVRTPDTDGDSDLDSDDKLSWTDFQAYPATLSAQSFGGYDDWRNPTIKELYSLIDFSGIDPSGYSGSTSGLVPFIDTDYFDFVYGDESAGERIIDAQYWSTTEYVGTVFGGEAAAFGVNFADGRIKGYPRDTGMGGTMKEFVRCVRGGTDYGVNSFANSGDSTITDEATELMWMKYDSGTGYDWEDALNYAENLVCAGYDDWRLPNAKELQSIVDYTRSPSTTGSAAIDPVFECTAITDEGGGVNYPFYWTGTTHASMNEFEPGAWAAYVCFGEGLGWMQEPFPPPPHYELQDVHGAGAQRSDPKSGDPNDYPYGHGPQGDVVRIYNYVRCVRDVGTPSGVGDPPYHSPSGVSIGVVPNPCGNSTEIVFSLPADGQVTVDIYDMAGRQVGALADKSYTRGDHRLRWDGRDSAGRALPAGIYLLRMKALGKAASAKVTLAR